MPDTVIFMLAVTLCKNRESHHIKKVNLKSTLSVQASLYTHHHIIKSNLTYDVHQRKLFPKYVTYIITPFFRIYAAEYV